MRSQDQIERDLAGVDRELRSLRDRVRGKGEPITAKAAEMRLAELSRKKEALRKEKAELSRPRGGGGGFSLITRDSLLKAAREMRAIQIGDVGSAGIGSIQQVRELFREVSESDELLNMASYYYGPNASTNIPVLSPMDEPNNYDEGAATVADDAGSGITVTEIQPTAYAIVLPVTAEMIQMGAVDIEAELPSIFAKAFSRKMHRGMLEGDNSSNAKLMRGLYASADAVASTNRIAASAGITVTELAELALTVAAKDESYRIVMNPAVYQAILSSSSNDSEDIKIYKEGLIRDKSIEGVPVFLDSLAPQKSGSLNTAIAAPLSRYAVGIAGELRIEPIRTPRDTKTYFQAIMFFSGKQVSDSDVYSVVAGS